MKKNIVTNINSERMQISGNFTWDEYCRIRREVFAVQGQIVDGIRKLSNRDKEGWICRISPQYRTDIVSWPKERHCWGDGVPADEFEAPSDQITITIKFDNTIQVGESFWEYHWEGVLK